MWEELVKFLGGAVIFMAAVTWLARSLFSHLLTKDIEIFKHELKAQSEKEMAVIRSSLELENEKVRIKLSGLEGRRLKVLEELYIRLVDFSTRASNFTYDPELQDEMNEIREVADKFIDDYYEFYNYFEKVGIFLPKALERSISRLHDDHFNVALEIGNLSDDDFSKSLVKINNNIPQIRSQTSDIITSVKREFRELLGVEI